MNNEAMTDERLAQILKSTEEAVAGLGSDVPLSPRPVLSVVLELHAEVLRMRACKVCDGARVLFNDCGTMRPAHGWTGPIHHHVVHEGEATACRSCKAMDDAQAPAPQHLWTEDVSLSELLTTLTGQRGLGLTLLPEDIGAYHLKGGFDATHLSLAGVLDEVTQLMGWTWRQQAGTVTVIADGPTQ